MFGSFNALTGRLDPPMNMASILSLVCWCSDVQELFSEKEVLFLTLFGVSALLDLLSGVMRMSEAGVRVGS